MYGPKSMTATGAVLTGQKIPGKFESAAGGGGGSTVGDKKGMDSDKASMINQFGQHRSVQYLVRKGLEDQAA